MLMAPRPPSAGAVPREERKETKKQPLQGKLDADDEEEQDHPRLGIRLSVSPLIHMHVIGISDYMRA